MKRTKLIGDVFHSVVPVGTAGEWSVGFSGHTNDSAIFSDPNFEIIAIRNIDDEDVPGTTDHIRNDVYIDYNSTSASGTTSIYVY